MMLDLLAALVLARPFGVVQWARLFVVSWELMYHVLIALCNPTDTWGEAYGSLSILTATVRSAALTISKPLFVGSLLVSSLKLRVRIGLSLGWKGGISIAVEYLRIKLSLDASSSVDDVTSNLRTDAFVIKKQESSLEALLRAYQKLTKYTKYWNFVDIRLENVSLELDDTISLTVKSIASTMEMNAVDIGLALGVSVEALQLQTIAHQEGRSAVPILQLSRTEGRYKTWLNREKGDSIDIEIGDCIVGASMHNAEVIAGEVALALAVLCPAPSPARLRYDFERLIHRFEAIDAQRRAIERRAAETGRRLQDLSADWAEEEGEDWSEGYCLALEGPEQRLFHGRPGSKYPASIGAKIKRVGIAMSTGGVRYQDQVLCLCEVEVSVSQRVESAVMALKADQETVRDVVATVGAVRTVTGTAGDLLHPDHLARMVPTAAQHDSVQGDQTPLTKYCTFTYEVVARRGSEGSSDDSGIRYESRIDGYVRPIELPLSTPALAAALTLVAECGAVLGVLSKQRTMAASGQSLRASSVPCLPAVEVALMGLDLSVPHLRVGLVCPTVTPATFRTQEEACPDSPLETLWVTLQGLSLTCSAPAPVAQGSPGTVQQFFLSVGTVAVSATAVQEDGAEVERDVLRCADSTLTKIVTTGVVSRESASALLAFASPSQWEQWAAAQLDSPGARYAEETTVQVGSLRASANQHDLRVLGTVQGLLAASSRLYEPLRHFHCSPVDTLHPGNLAPSKLYVVLLDAFVELRWVAVDPLDEVVYSVLDRSKLSYSAQTIGGLYARSSAYLHRDDVVLNRSTGGGGSRPVEIARIARVDNIESSARVEWEDDGAARLGGTESWSRRMCLFTAKCVPNECYTPLSSGVDSGAGVGALGFYMNVQLPQLLLSLDCAWVEELCLLLRAHSLGTRLAEQVVVQHLQRGVVDPAIAPPVALNVHMMQLSSPSSITAVHVEYLKVNMYHEQEPVLSLTSRKIDLHLMEFGPALSQTVVVMHSLRVFELTAKYAVHTCIVGDIDASMPNRVEFHLTSRVGECSLFEAQLEQVRVFYLQRSTMVLISYVRDHFIRNVYAGLGTESSVTDCDLVSVVWAPELPPARGLTRIGAVFTKSEVHLPLNSCGTDAVVIVIDTFTACRTFPVTAATTHTTTYCKGPYILRKQWLSEIRNSRRVIYQLFSDRGPSLVGQMEPTVTAVGAGTSALSQLFPPLQSVADPSGASNTPVPGSVTGHTAPAAVRWVLPHVAAEALTAPSEVPHYTHPELCLDLVISNANICAWCDTNAVADDITLTGHYELSPLPLGPDGGERNRVWVDVVAEELEWVLAQGQYLSIINLIQQNFCELQELVPDIWPLPVPKTVNLTEELYGKYGLDSSLPIFSTVPLHIRKGSITAVESLPEYFELSCAKLPPAHYPYGVRGHDIPPSWCRDPRVEVAFEDTVPVHSKHVYHRNRVFARMASSSAARAASGGSSKGRSPRNRQQAAEAQRGDVIIGVLFEDLEVDFFRLHEGGGNGIEVAAGTFVIVGIDDRNTDDDDLNSVHSLSLDDLTLDSIIFAPRSFPLLNSGGNSSVFSAAKATANSPRKKRSASRETKSVSSPGAGDTESSTKPAPHITYSQQGTENLRRCVVTISDSMAVANIAKILHAVQYFLNPVHVNTHRSLYCIAASHLGPYDFKIGLDMEVHVNNTVVCLTNISRRDGASALCFHVNLDYVEAWRGFLSSGPGKIGLNIDISVSNIYIAPMREINSSRIQSLVDPCVLVVGQDMMTHPPEHALQRNLDLLTPWMSLGKWAHKVNKTDQPSTTRIVKFKVAPAAAAAASAGQPAGASRAGQKATPECGDTAAEETEAPGEDAGEAAESVSEESVSEPESPDTGGRSPRFGDNGDAYYSGADRPGAAVVRVQISTKDIYFIAQAVKQARTALKKRLIITTTQEDHFAESKSMLQDIAHLPQLTYYLVATPLDTPSKKNKNNELLAEICDFEAILRNNTYNLNILRLNIFDNCMLYTRSPELLHMAAGSACAMWAYNEATDLWEPLIEPFNLRAIGATDESIQAAGMLGAGADGAKRSGAKIRIEVVTDPVELNAPQTALGHLIRKLSLADVVTTSSIHLPPYKVINELGVDVKFSIGMGDAIITEKDIEPGRSLPVEVQQLAEALEAYKFRRNMTIGGSIEDRTSHKEYVMGITFANFRDVYASRTPLPIDKVGVLTYDMASTGQKLPDPSGTDVNFDRRRISMSGMGSQKYSLAASIASAAAAAAKVRSQGRRGDADEADEVTEASMSLEVPQRGDSEGGPDTALPDGSLDRTASRDVTYESAPPPPPDLSPRTPNTKSAASAGADSPRPEVHGFSDQPPSIPNSPARPASTLFRRNSVTGSSSAPEPIKYMQEVPLVVMEMRIKADGVREILLRSILSFKNNTSRILQISVRLYGSSVETSLAPGVEWFVPVRFVNPKASLYIRLDERANWFEALSSMQGLVVQGYWGDPSRLRAHLCACPAESAESREGGNGWMLLIKPEVKDAKAQMQGTGGRCFIPVRYPNKDAYMKVLKEGINSVDPGSAGMGNAAGGPVLKSRGSKAQPMCIQLLAPLQLCNLVPQPLLYRLADADGLITSEGVLLPGELIDVHTVCKLFMSRIFISVRMLNYCWSKWTLVFSRTNPLRDTEHSTDLTLNSLSLRHDGRELTLPSVDLLMVSREYLIRFCCPVVISNRSGLLLDLCEPSTTESYLPFSSRTPAEAFLSLLSKHGHGHHHNRQRKKAVATGPTGVNDTPSVSERASFRRQRTMSAEGMMGFRNHASHFHAEQLPSDLLHDMMAQVDEEEGELEETDDTSEDSTGSSAAEESLGRSNTSSDAGDSFDEGDKEEDEVDGAQQSGPGIRRFSQPRQRSAADSSISSDLLPTSPISPADTEEATPSYATPVASFMSPVGQVIRQAAAARALGQIIQVVVHLPFDHLRCVEVAASSDWTLLDVFRKVKHRVASSSVHQTSANYVFFLWENGKLGPRKVDNSLIIEAQEQLEGANGNDGEAKLGRSATIVEGSAVNSGQSAVTASGPGAPLSKERSVSMFSRDKKVVDTEIPAPMQFEMLAECSLTPLPMSTRVETLTTKRLRLCHAAEWEVYKQVKAIKTEVIEKEGLFSSMFSRPKCTHHATLVPFEGDIPFKPHRMMGFNPSLSLRVPSAGTDWSDAVGIVKGTFDSSELSIVAVGNPLPAAAATSNRLSMRGPPQPSATQPLVAAPLPTYYEFGAYLERGRGFLQNVTTVTLVPKHILVSKLSFAVQIRQITPSVDCEPTTLPPMSLCSYHFPSRSKSKLLQMRKVVVPSSGSAGAGAGSAETSPVASVVPAGEWLAELDITKIGILYAKLRDPVQIIKVQIDSVGASLVVTLSEQSMLWPPYRIDNMTAMEVRFRQAADSVGYTKSALAAVTRRANTNKGGLETVPEGAVPDLSADDQSAAPTAPVGQPPRPGTNLLPWDHIERANSAPFAWDLPFTGKKAIQVEVRQLNTSWVPCEVFLDDDDKLPPLVVKKAAPSLGNPLAEGYLLRQDATGDGWTKVYCILRQDVLYVYPDETRDYLIEVISLSKKQVNGGAAQFASVTRYADKRRAGTMGLISSVIGNSGSRKGADINKTRTTLLQIADYLGLLASVSEHAFLKARTRSISAGEEVGSPSPQPDEDSLQPPQAVDDTLHGVENLRVSFYLPLSGRPSDTADNAMLMDAKAAADSSKPQLPVDETPPASDEVAGTSAVEATGPDDEEGNWDDLLRSRDTFSNLPPPITAGDAAAFIVADAAGLADAIAPTESTMTKTAEGEDRTETLSRESIVSSRRSRFSSSPAVSLTALLSAKVSVEELLEEVGAVPVRVADVIEALVTTKLVEKVDRAKDMCEWMLAEGYLKPKAATRAIDGSGFGGESGTADELAAAAMRLDPLSEGGEDFDSDEDPEERADQFPTGPTANDGVGVVKRYPPTANGSRVSLSRQTSRTSFSGGGSEEHSADVPVRKSIVSLSRRKLIKLYEDTDLFFCPPPLNPEMMAMLEQINAEEEGGAQVAGSAGTGTAGAAEAEVHGFTIAMDSAKYTFRCSSEMEFFGWIQACRQSIELAWAEHLTGQRADKKPVSLEDFQATILLRLRADGSTKVLEIMQDDENITKEARNKSKNRLRGGRKNKVSSAEAIGKLSRVIRNSHLAPSLTPDTTETKEINREKELIFVLFSVQSLALSVINSEPAELLYLSLRGIEMTVERSIDLVKFSGTVQEIQLSNQLLAPEFAVALFPRRMKEGTTGRLMLPGLNPETTTFPSLHLYIQQRYHQSISDVGNPAAADSFEEDSHLHYFEMFTLWISPMKLDVDEEIIVKCIRYGRGLRDAVYSPMLGRGSETQEDLLNLQQLGSKSWEGHAERAAVFQLYMRLLDAGKVPYQTYSPSAKSSTGIFLSLLQLHPIDVVMSFRNSPNMVVSNSELAMVSIISQLDSARLCLNALIAEHAFGSPQVLGRVLLKHYKAAFWRQFHKLIGASDIVEGSVGLVANLGSGVYDLFYEPIDGLLDENGSFLTGLSKGGISLASRTIGGTSAFTSQITGGLGKGVSLLTLDSQFQRNRAYRRFNKSSTVSEGIYVGTQELGKNIVEGVTGIVVSPYRGWESGGGVGLGMGIAKGILGVALKPAVGVFDLASRATEGLRNAALSDTQDALERYGIHRKRIPRAFGRNGQIALYDAKAAAAQYVADCVTLFRPEPRLHVVHHLYIRRKLQKFIIPSLVTESPQSRRDEDEDELLTSESWGFPLGRTYLVLVGASRIVLAELCPPDRATGPKRGKRRAYRQRKFIWSCPANCIDQLFSDPNGDLILNISSSAQITGPWNGACPVVLDNQAQNYVIFQSLLEQTIGHRRARQQPLAPTEGLIQADIRKRYSTGIKSFLMAPSNHTYRLCGHVLYEYSDTAAKRAAMKADAAMTGSSHNGLGAEGAEGSDKSGAAEAEPATYKSDSFIDQMVARIFPVADPTSGVPERSPAGVKNAGQPAPAVPEPGLEDMYMSFVYPLADLYIAGPTPEDGGRATSITLSRLDGQKMRVLKSDEDQEHFGEYLKNSLSLIFARHEDACAWKHALEEAMLWNLDEEELVPPGPLTTEDRRKQGRTILTMGRGAEEIVQPMDDSILGVLVLPTSGCKAEQTETIKIEIAKTLSATRWR